MPFDGTADRPAAVRTFGTPPCAPPVEARIIDEALEILGPNGERWIQGSETDCDHNHCMIGAIKLARRRLGVKGDKTVRLINNEIQRYRAASEDRWRKESGVVDFNDRPDRTFEQVRETFLLARREALSRAARRRPNLVGETGKLPGRRT